MRKRSHPKSKAPASNASSRTGSEIGKPVKKSVKSKTILVSRDNIRNAIAFFLQSVGEIKEFGDIVLLHLGDPKGELREYFVELSYDGAAIPVTYYVGTEIKDKGRMVHKKING